MSDELPTQFIDWYRKKFQLDKTVKYWRSKKFLESLKITSPKSYKFFVAKFKEENPNSELSYNKFIPDGYEKDGNPIFTLMADPINVPIDPKEFYSILETKENRCCI